MKNLINYLSAGNSTESNPSQISWETYLKTALKLVLWGICLAIMLLVGYFGHYYWQQRFPPLMPLVVVVQPDFELSDTKFVFKKQPLPITEAESSYDSESVDNNVVSDAEIPASESIDDNVDEQASEGTEVNGALENQENSLHDRVQQALNDVQLEQKSR